MEFYYEIADYCIYPYVQIDQFYMVSYRPDHLRSVPSMYRDVRFNGGSSRIGAAVEHAPGRMTCDYRVIGAYGLMYNQTSYTDFPIAQAVLHHVDEQARKQVKNWKYEVCYPFLYFEAV